jgi:hypothetical protein
VAIRERVLAEDHPDRLASQHVLARAYLADGQVKKAVPQLEHVVAIQERVLAEDHPDRLASQYVLASAHQADRQLEQSGSYTPSQADEHGAGPSRPSSSTSKPEETLPRRQHQFEAPVHNSPSQVEDKKKSVGGRLTRLWRKFGEKVR